MSLLIEMQWWHGGNFKPTRVGWDGRIPVPEVGDAIEVTYPDATVVTGWVVERRTRVEIPADPSVPTSLVMVMFLDDKPDPARRTGARRK